MLQEFRTSNPFSILSNQYILNEDEDSFQNFVRIPLHKLGNEIFAFKSFNYYNFLMMVAAIKNFVIEIQQYLELYVTSRLLYASIRPVITVMFDIFVIEYHYHYYLQL